jgi:hypothetical protein
MRSVRPLLLASLLLPACSGQPDGAPAAGPTTPPLAALVSVRDGNGAAGPFRIRELAKLRIEVALTGARPGAHQLRLDVLSPGGTLYAQLPAAVEVGPTGEGTGASDLQVRGTTIERYRRTGTWAVRAWLDGAAQPLASAEAEVLE